MNRQANDLWERATKAQQTAGNLITDDPDAAASRAYYAAFYAVSAYFSLNGKSFSKHSAVEAAVHRDLIQTGIWERELGEGYSFLRKLRQTGDYGLNVHVSTDEAENALQTSKLILQAVQNQQPEFFRK